MSLCMTFNYYQAMTMKTQMIRQVKQSLHEALLRHGFPEYNVGNQKLTLSWSFNTEQSWFIIIIIILHLSLAGKSRERERERDVMLQVLLCCLQCTSWKILKSSYAASIADDYFFYYLNQPRLSAAEKLSITGKPWQESEASLRREILKSDCWCQKSDSSSALCFINLA